MSEWGAGFKGLFVFNSVLLLMTWIQIPALSLTVQLVSLGMSLSLSEPQFSPI